MGLVPEYGMSVYGATKAFVIFLSQGLAFELGPKDVYVQAVLPAGTRTELWERGSLDPATLQPMMDVNDLSTPRCRALTSARRSPFRRCPMQHFGMPIRPRVRP